MISSFILSNNLRVYFLGIERVFGLQNALYVRYENLKDKSTRLDELGKIAAFLDRPASQERLQCAFILAKSDQVIIDNHD